MLDGKKKARPAGGTAGQAAGIGFAAQVPGDDYTTVCLKKRSLFAGWPHEHL